MKWNHLIFKSGLFLIAVTFTGFLTVANAGWFGNGGSSAKDSDNPWFLGDDSIPYCVLTNGTTVPTAPAIQQMVKINSQKWGQFFDRYQNNQFGKIRKFPDLAIKKIVTVFEKSNSCEEVYASCDAKSFDENKCQKALADKVLFLVGRPNPIVKKYMDINGEAQGVALRTNYNHESYRSGGIVWVNELRSGGWSNYIHMLLHEMGHVVGMVHDSCWVMNQDVAAIIKIWSGIGELGEIESANWPYSYKNGDTIIFTDHRYIVSELPKGFYPNKLLPAQILQLIGFDKSSGFKLSAKIKQTIGNKMLIDLIFEESSTGKMVVGSGRLDPKSFLDVVTYQPRLFTNWKNNSESSTATKVVEYQTDGWLSTDLQGKVSFNDVAIPMTLTRQRGLTISLFHPEAGYWFNLETVQRQSPFMTKFGY